MGFSSTKEDIEERLEGNIRRDWDCLRERFVGSLKDGILTEAKMQQELSHFEKRVIEPLEAIRRQSGECGLDLGNELRKIQMHINSASNEIKCLVKESEPQPGEQIYSIDISLNEIIQRFIDQHIRLIRIVEIFSSATNARDRPLVNKIKCSCERDISAIKRFNKILSCREKSIADLYQKLQSLQTELDFTRKPGSAELNPSGYDDWPDYTQKMQIRPIKHKR
ncbi:hypothetical protein KKP04_13970 [Rhodomicrobium sp. Az07]|uniref:hypothetical protein n=1 Tax=Rhodomicrobium sp. Az07 TaxID=2839034 RepID=UPI001BEB734B|nr:hypothetical protein [Rhodomicrobium sp. Az07]MBT3071968.1 hypothetical protein [Rhodomicrobium sp. Az07]